MATTAERALGISSPARAGVLTQFIDRWIYVFMAALFVVTVLVGFVPDSIAKVSAVQAGMRPPFPPVLHVHAVLMGSWLLLLLTQTTLMATGRQGFHQKLGIAGMFLMPAIVITGVILIPVMWRQLAGALATLPSGPARDAVAQNSVFATRILLFQFRVGIAFPLVVVIAVLARRTDPGLHKRLMILATAMPLPAAIDRIAFLPTTLPASPMAIELYTLLWISPMFLWDLYRTHRVHRAYIIWFLVCLPFSVLAHVLWTSEWWAAAAPRIVGVAF